MIIPNILYIGISDKQHIIGVDNSKKLMEDIPNKIVSKLGIYPDVRLLEEDGKEIIEIEVAPSQESVLLDGVLYKRVGATNQIVKGQALKDFYARKLKVACQRKALTIPSRKSSRTWKS